MKYTPVSDKVRAAITGDDPQLLSEIEVLERIASAGVAHVAANGRFPNWPVDRWITVLGFLGMLIGLIWFAGARWTGTERDIAELKQDVQRLTFIVERGQAVSAASSLRLQESVDEQAEPAPARPATQRPSSRSSFPQSEGLRMGRPEP